MGALRAAVAHLNALPGSEGYVTEVFSRQARFFQPHNAARIDAVRDAIEAEFARSALYPLLLTSLIEAADRVDSTTGVQMAYVKAWSPRSFNPLELRVPELLTGPGRAVKGDAVELAPVLGHFDLAYLDPPYNQHRYFTNYHVWETLVAWDAPEAYGVAANASMRAIRRRARRSTPSGPWPKPWARWSHRWTVTCSCCPTTTNRGLRSTSWRPCAPSPVRGALPRGPWPSSPSTPRVTWGRASGSSTQPGARSGGVGHLSNRELLVIAGEADLVRHVVDVVRSGASTPVEPTGSRADQAVADASMVDRLQQAT